MAGKIQWADDCRADRNASRDAAQATNLHEQFGAICTYRDGLLQLTATNVVVLHDELDLNPGQLRTKTGGGTAGHRGLQSLQSHLGNEFSRIRIGIGHPGRKELVNRYVLHDFAGEETAGFDNLLMAISKSALYLAAGDFAKFTSAVAQHRNSPSHTDTGIVQPAPPPEKRTATSLIAQLAQRFGR